MKKLTKILFTIATVATIFLTMPDIPTYAASSIPTDIMNHPAKDVIIWAIDHDYMSGTGNNKFSPDTPVTRAQLVQVLYNINKQPKVDTNQNPFTDTKGHWSEKAVTWAYKNKLTSGTTSTTFSPNKNVTKEQTVTIFKRYADMNQNDDITLDYTYLSNYTDTNQISNFAKAPMCWAVQYGLLQSSDDKLNPKQQLSRAELARTLKNYMEPTPPDKPYEPDLTEAIRDVITQTNVALYSQLFDHCNSTKLEREVMMVLTNVKFQNLTPTPNYMSSLYVNQLWYDPRYVAKVTVQEAAREQTLSTERMRQHPVAKDYFNSIYSERNLHNATYVDTFWYYVIKLPADKSAKSIATEFLKSPDFTAKLKTSSFTFYGIYVDTSKNYACVAHGNATAG